MSYKNTFITVSPDCPTTEAIVPVTTKEKKPVHRIQYELLMENPYKYNYDELLFETHVRYKHIPAKELQEHRQQIWDALFTKKHACLRASALPKKYGWGVHYDAEGKIALYGMDSPEYRRYAESSARDGLQLLAGMRSKKI